MSADQPRTGDTITTAEQLDALPLGSVVEDKHDDIAFHISRGEWAFTETAALGSRYVAKRFQPLTVLFVPGEQPSPSVEDARAEAKRRYSSATPANYELTYPSHALEQHRRGAFVAGAEWAASRAVPSAHTAFALRLATTRSAR